MKRLLAGAVVAMSVACGGPGNVSGTVSGTTFTVNDAIFASMKDAQTGAESGALIVLASVADVCTTMKAKKDPKNASAVGVALMHMDAQGKSLPLVAGDYPILDLSTMTSPPSFFASVVFTNTDATCKDMMAEGKSQAASGTVKLTAYDAKAGGKAEGTFDVVVGSQGDKVTGSFGATFCDYTPKDGETTTCE